MKANLSSDHDSDTSTCFLLDLTEDVEERRLHPVTVQSMFPETHEGGG